MLTGQTGRGAALGRRRRRRVVRCRTTRRLGVVRLGAGDVARGDLCRRPGADADRRELRRRRRAAVEPVAGHRAAPAGRGAPAHGRRRPGAHRVRGDGHARRVARQHRHRRRRRIRARPVRDGSRPVDRRRDSMSTWRSPPSTNTGWTTTRRPYSLSPRPRGSRCTEATSTRRATPAHASDARTAVVHVRDAVAGRTGAAPPGQGVRGAGGPVDRSSPPARDRRHPAPADRWAPSATRSRSCASSVTSASPAGATGASPLSPAELRLLPYLQTHLTFREIGERLFVSRNTISSEVGSIYRKLGVSSRSDAVQQATAMGLLGG